MDDWKGLEEISCGKFNVKECLREVMQNAAAWIGVSETLLHQIATRYQISSPRRLILHNPPRLPAQTPRAYTPDAARRFRVIYAGSIWGMHFDALAAVARAVAILNDRGVAIELVIHTTEHFWREHRTALSLNGTVYGGQIPYESLSTALSRGDLLLVCSSFLESNELLAKGSLQTKTTDYMVSRRAVLAVGPAESASNKFIEQWKCGICITSQDPLCIAASLEQAVRNPQTLTALADAGYEAVKEHFCQTAAFSRFNSFLLEQSGANS